MFPGEVVSVQTVDVKCFPIMTYLRSKVVFQDQSCEEDLTAFSFVA
jgi:hypothetical protein